MDTTRLRRLFRVLHRDAGHLVVGLTFVYALSGLAVNHIGDWDPNFVEVHRELRLTLPSEEAPLAAAVSEALGYDAPDDVYELGEGRWEFIYGESTVTADVRAGAIVEEGREPRPLLRAVNWLHLNRGKAAWTLIADGYAILLLFLALSGVSMLPIRNGLLGRPGLLLAAGALLPILFVALSS